MAAAIVTGTAVYAVIGLIVGVAFLFRGIERVDPAAHGAFAFRPLLLPGCVMLWPVVAFRWWRAV